MFDDKREDNLKEKLAEEQKEKAEYAKKVGQLTMQIDWLKKNLKKFVDLTTRVSLVQNLLTTKEISVSVGAQLLDINRTSIYYKGNVQEMLKDLLGDTLQGMLEAEMGTVRKQLLLPLEKLISIFPETIRVNLNHRL